jgi:DNA polymerase-3 subunit epsilon
VIRSGSRAWREASFAVLDFETTGLDLERDHVLSYGLVPVEGGRARLADRLYRVVRPPTDVSAASIRVHGIRPVELEGASPLDEVAGELRDALRGRLLVAHASAIELSFLGQVFVGRKRGRPRHALDVIDLAREVARREGAAAPESRRLSHLAERFGVPVGRTHHALADALVTAQLFLVLATALELAGAGRVRDLRRAGRVQFATNFVHGGS